LPAGLTARFEQRVCEINSCGGEESDSPPPRYQYRDRREKINEVTVNVPLIPAPRIFKAPANTVTIGIAAL
jgi:hypothetical protein